MGSAYPDGCANSPACTPGSPTCYQQTDFFTGYTGVNYGPNRPPWNVAGVDYPVGVNDSCIKAGLRNPATNPPSGTNYSSGTLYVIGNNVTIDCYDMSHTDIDMASASGAVTVSNNKFDNESGMSCPYNPGAGTHALNVVAKYNTFHGATGNNTFNDFIHYACTGNVTSEYNYFHVASKDFMEFSTRGSGHIALIQFNFGQCLAASNGAHGQPNEDYGSIGGTTRQTFNTFYDDGCQSGFTSNGVTALCEFNSGGPAGGSGPGDESPVCSNNTLVDTYGDADVIEMGDTTTGTITINNNYIVYGKAPYYFYQPPGTTTVSTGNVNMRNGKACNAYAGSC